jgi:hypothetical protein
MNRVSGPPERSRYRQRRALLSIQDDDAVWHGTRPDGALWDIG